jgi:hypothetical protein
MVGGGGVQTGGNVYPVVSEPDQTNRATHPNEWSVENGVNAPTPFAFALCAK